MPAHAALRYVAPGVLQDPAARSGSARAYRRPQERPRGGVLWFMGLHLKPGARRGAWSALRWRTRR
jgi:hypothetical protein